MDENEFIERRRNLETKRERNEKLETKPFIYLIEMKPY